MPDLKISLTWNVQLDHQKQLAWSFLGQSLFVVVLPKTKSMRRLDKLITDMELVHMRAYMALVQMGLYRQPVYM